MEERRIVEHVIDYEPRRQFIPFHERSERFACIVTHRRAGKTVACVHDLQRGALACMRERPRFAYLSPFLKQAKAVAWDYLRAAMAPARALGASANETELRVDYPNGGQVRLYGADNYEALRGLYLDGVVLDEYADMDPRAWTEVIRPALADRGGWAVFIGTPKGRNAFYEMWRKAQNEGWFHMMLKASETGLLSAAELALAAGDLSEEQYAQEFECSFEAAIVGAYYGKLMAAAERDQRISGVPHDPSALVWTSWDLGIRDATAIWFAQVIGREIHIIDYYEASGVDLGHYVRELNARPYAYAGHIVPHDARAKELGTGKSPARSAGEPWPEEPHARGAAPGRGRHQRGARLHSAVLVRSGQVRARGGCAQALSRRARRQAAGAQAAARCTTGPRTRRTAFRYLAMTLDAKAVQSGFHRRIEYQRTGIV